MSRRLSVVVTAFVLVGCLAWVAVPYLSAAAFVLDLSGSTSWVRRAIPVRVQAVVARDLEIPTRHGPMSARLYTPARRTGTLIVFPGIHAGGVDEPRLAAFSRRLAGTGLRVISAPLPELRRYQITPSSTDRIEDAVRWVADQPDLAPERRVDIAGVSFAGGLALVAAGRPSIAASVGRLVALGSQADLPRVMTYLCTGRLSDGSTRPPHDYGVAIILLAELPRLVPASQIELSRQAIVTFLDASSFATMDPAKSSLLAADARGLAEAAPEPARTLLRLVNDRRVAELGPRLLPYVEEFGGFPALSPDRSPPARAQVFLLHGAADNVIPSTETPLLASYLRGQGNDHVRWLLTPLLSHADLREPQFMDAWRMIRFWNDLTAR